MDLRELIIDEIKNSKMLSSKLIQTVKTEQEREIKETVKIEGNDLNERILTYIKEKNMELTQDNYEIVKKYLQDNADEEGILTIKHIIPGKYTDINLIEKCSDEELERFLQLCIFEKLSEIKGDNTRYEYKVESILDNQSGTADVTHIERILNSYAEQGWHLKCTFTNEVEAKFSYSFQTCSDTGYGRNSVSNQIIMVFERIVEK